MGWWEWPDLGLGKGKGSGEEKVVITEGCLTGVGDEELSKAKGSAAEVLPGGFASAKGIRLAVLVGGGRERDFAWYTEDVTRFTKMLMVSVLMLRLNCGTDR